MALSPHKPAPEPMSPHQRRRRFSRTAKNITFRAAGEFSAANYQLFTIATELAAMRPDRRRKRAVCALFPPNVAGKTKPEIRGRWGFVLRISLRVVVVASAVATALPARSAAPPRNIIRRRPALTAPPYDARSRSIAMPMACPTERGRLSGRLYAPQPMPAEDDGQVFMRARRPMSPARSGAT